MITENRQNVNTENTVECQFGNAIRELKISSLLKASNVRKKKGGSVFDVFQFLLLLVFQNCNLYHFLNQCHLDNGEKNVCRFLQKANGQGKMGAPGRIRDIFHPASLGMGQDCMANKQIYICFIKRYYRY